MSIRMLTLRLFFLIAQGSHNVVG
ncbi:unnamed protein product [Fusarium venenatum]|uniref:Uncharacterized protein n=1 Tax=Fusarium venenatum TaxID=56646 RepID=A0A2L2SZ71_9HYPO|nr:unnamed protein product [Fusarium venenatum]